MGHWCLAVLTRGECVRDRLETLGHALIMYVLVYLWDARNV